MLSFGKIKLPRFLAEGTLSVKSFPSPESLAIVESKIDGQDAFASADVYAKGVYSHGFEKIYALENIDIKSIKKVVSQALPELEKKIATQKKDHHLVVKEKRDVQLKFNFLSREEEGFESFKLDEQVQSLQLSLQAEKKVLQRGFKTIRELLIVKSEGILAFNSIGQGHFDEIIIKLNTYLGEGDCYRTDNIEFLSILRCLLQGIDKKKAYITLSSYGLECYFTISPSDFVAVKHVQGKKRQEICSDVLLEIRESAQKYLSSTLEKIYNILILPWLCRRNGIATEEEIVEYVFKKSDQMNIAISVWCFITEGVLENIFPFKPYLHEVANNVYAVDKRVVEQYIQVIDKAKSYFYSPSVTYSFDALVLFLMKELVKEWQDIPQALIEKALRLSSLFRVRKAENGLLMIRRL